MESTKNPEQANWSEQSIRDLIRKLRNDLIKDFLDERHLLAYFAEQYNRKELTSVNVDLMKKGLKQLLVEPVDEKHYHDLIEQIRETGTTSISNKHEGLFLKDIEKVLKQYAY